MKNNKVFISHSSKDRLLATALCHYLESKNIRCWMAPRDINVGKDYAQSIMEAIEDSAIMIVIFSGFTNTSQHIKNEVERAFNHQLVVMPFRIENILPSRSLEYFLSSTHWLDAFDDKPEKYFEELRRNCEAILNISKETVTEENKINPLSQPVPVKQKASSSKYLSIIAIAVSIVAVIIISLLLLNNKNKQQSGIIALPVDTLKKKPDSIIAKPAQRDTQQTTAGINTGKIDEEDKDDDNIPKASVTVSPEKIKQLVEQQVSQSVSLPSSVNGIYWQPANANEFTLGLTGNAVAISGRAGGKSIAGILRPVSKNTYRLSAQNATGSLTFSNNYNNISGTVHFTDVNVDVPVNLVKKL